MICLFFFSSAIFIRKRAWSDFTKYYAIVLRYLLNIKSCIVWNVNYLWIWDTSISQLACSIIYREHVLMNSICETWTTEIAHFKRSYSRFNDVNQDFSARYDTSSRTKLSLLLADGMYFRCWETHSSIGCLRGKSSSRMRNISPRTVTEDVDVA